jgi:hypothetical protein
MTALMATIDPSDDTDRVIDDTDRVIDDTD